MFKVIFKIFMSAALFQLMVLNNAGAQQSLLSFKPGARAIGIGGSGVTGVQDPSVLYWNPALLGDIHENRVFASIQQPYILNYIGYSQFIPLYGAFSIQLSHFNDVDFGSIGWGNQFGDFNLGVSLSSYTRNTESWTAFGFGFTFKPKSALGNSGVFTDRLSIGLSGQNIPLIITEYDHQIRLGGAYELIRDDVLLYYAHHFQRENNTDHLGFMFSLLPSVKLFAGIQNFDNNYVSFGTGIDIKNIRFDLAYDSQYERIVVSSSFRMGQSAVQKANENYESARYSLQNRDRRKAYHYAKRAIEYQNDHQIAREMVNALEQIVKTEDHQIDSLLVVARAFEDKEWFISAAAHYLKILRMNPDHKEARAAIKNIRPNVNIHTEKWYQLGVRHFELGDLEKAKDVFESILLVRRDHQGSQTYLQKINEIFQQEANKHYYAGLGFFSQRNFNRAEEEFQTALDYVPYYNDANDYLKRIRKEKQENVSRINRLFAKASDFENSKSLLYARNLYQEILNLDTDNQRARYALRRVNDKLNTYVNSLFYSAQDAYEQNDLKTAARVYRKILEIDPNHKKARQALQEITESTLKVSNKYFKLAEDYTNRGEYEKALALLDSLHTIEPDSKGANELRNRVLSAIDVEKLFKRAQDDYYNGLYIQALDKLDKVLEKDPDHALAIELLEQSQIKLNQMVDEFYNRGIQLYADERYRMAIQEWKRALEINPYHKGSKEYIEKANERIKALNKLP